MFIVLFRGPSLPFCLISFDIVDSKNDPLVFFESVFLGEKLLFSLAETSFDSIVAILSV
jgi:hypothetical protein